MNESDCVLKLNHLVFDELSFRRKNFQSENDIHFEFGFNFEQRGDVDFVAPLQIKGIKENEYDIGARASGYFTLNDAANYDFLTLRQNAVAIVFPYLRSQISLLTAQPEVKPVIIPPMNIAQMVEDTLKAQSESLSNEKDS